MAQNFDMVVIGAGPGGYVAAIRGAQLGLKVACIEREHLGGICLNWGCIPTKALLRSAEVFHLMHRAKDFGLSAEGIGFDLEKVVARSRGVAKQLTGGIGHLFKKNKVTTIMGEARLVAPGKVSVKTDKGAEEITGKAIVLATGGIGGVHRGAEHSFDISADLQELAQTPVTVVAAGAKAILDLPKTLEVLETLGVPVIAFGQDELPAFWSRSSGIKAPLRMDSADQIAASAAMRARLGLKGGQLVANPIPPEAEIAREEITPVIEQALAEAEARQIAAKQVTPFLLQRIFEITEGRSLASNIELVLNNARLAAQIAIAMTR